MYVAGSLLNPIASRQTEGLWAWLEDRCGLAGIKMTPLPHFSWQAAEGYNFNKVEEILSGIAQRTVPFSIQTTGIGLFTGPQPVVYLTMIKSRRLLELHEEIWRGLEPWALTLNPYYDPVRWVPHITLAYRDVTPDNLACALKDLAFQNLVVDVRVDHVAVLYDLDGEIGIRARYDFQG